MNPDTNAGHGASSLAVQTLLGNPMPSSHDAAHKLQSQCVVVTPPLTILHDHYDLENVAIHQ